MLKLGEINNREIKWKFHNDKTNDNAANSDILL